MFLSNGSVNTRLIEGGYFLDVFSVRSVQNSYKGGSCDNPVSEFSDDSRPVKTEDYEAGVKWPPAWNPVIAECS
jgi:hypothetical protein